MNPPFHKWGNMVTSPACLLEKSQEDTLGLLSLQSFLVSGLPILHFGVCLSIHLSCIVVSGVVFTNFVGSRTLL